MTNTNKQKKDKDIFMRCVYVSLILLAIIASIVYFFGYDFFKNFIKV